MKFLILAVIFCFQTAQAGNVSDPNNILGQVDQFLGSVPFEQGLKCGDEAVIGTTKCPNCKPKPSGATITNCEPDKVLFERTNKEPKVINRSDYESIKGNLLRFVLQELDLDTKLEKMTLQLGGFNGQTLETAEIIVKAKNYKGTITIGKGLPLIAQVLSISVPDLNYSVELMSYTRR